MAGEADYESEIMAKDRKLSEKDRKVEIEKLQRYNQDILLNQKRLFDDMIAAEKQQIQEHYKRLEADRKAYMEREEHKRNIIMKKWQEEKELNKLQIQEMMTENEKQRNEFRNDTKLHEEIREKENRERYDRLVAQERALKLQSDNMNDRMQNMSATSDKHEMENMKFMIRAETSYKNLQRKQAEERRIAELNLQMVKEEERNRFDDLRHQENLKFEAVLEQERIESNALHAEIRSLKENMNDQMGCNVC